MSDPRPLARATLPLALAALLAAPAVGRAARVEVRQLLDTSPLGDPFVFDVSPDGAVLVLTGDNVHDAGAGANLFATPLERPAWLDLDGGVLRFIADDGLFAVHGGAPRMLLDLPLTSRVFASDGARTFLSGVTADGRAILFLHEEGKGHKAVLELDEPIDAMATARGALFFTAGHGIFALHPGGPARLVARLPAFSRIPSLAVDAQRGVLYFSDGEAIYALRGDDFVVVRRGLGGMLRWRGDALYVLSWKEHALFRLSGLGVALRSPGALAPWKDPCEEPVTRLYCRAAAERALLEAAGERPGPGAEAARRDDFVVPAALVEARREAMGRIEAALASEATTGVEGVVWTADAEPRAVRARAAVATGTRGAAISLWDGSELRVGPDSRLVLGDCRPSGTCRQTLERGLLYVAARPPPAGGTARLRGFAIAAAPLSLAFDEARVAVFTSGELTAVLVLEGQARATAPGRGAVTISAGELLEARRGEALGAPAVADPGRVNRWWEKVQ